jgi:hypothetical protein
LRACLPSIQRSTDAAPARITLAACACSQLVLSPAAAARAESRRLGRFVRMLAVGVPPEAVRSAMAREGLAPAQLDALALAPLLL